MECSEDWVVVLIPGDREVAVATLAGETPSMTGELLAVAAARTDGVFASPARRQVDGVRGPRHHGPAARRRVGDLEKGDQDGHGPGIDIEHRFDGRQVEHAVPAAPPQLAVHVGLEPSPLHNRVLSRRGRWGLQCTNVRPVKL